jgi:hypothetical protein
MPETSDPPPNLARRRGGQPGNVNAATHGFYSRQLQPTDLAEIETTRYSSVDQEIELMRISIRRLVEMTVAPKTVAEANDQMRTLCLAMQTLSSLLRTQCFMVIHRGDLR